ncbi:MAG: 3-phosphoshikimate 1-carboxyvinyltransferase [Kiritimatiellia bacterium]
MILYDVLSPGVPLRARVPLVASKSESNRALILRALAGSAVELDNLSEARDTRLLESLLSSEDEVLDARDAGTTLRFLTAWCAAANRPAVITGTPRMQQRPVGILVEALRTLGTDIHYEGDEGFPPVRVEGFTQRTREVTMRGDVSSQYTSALLLIAPFLPQGLKLTLSGAIASRPYIDMTLEWMRRFGLVVKEDRGCFEVAPQCPQPGRYTIESDWSAAGYWYTLMALAGEGELKLMHLREASLQGDRVLADLFVDLGVQSEFVEDGVILRPGPRAGRFEADFTHIPDQAQTFAVCCAGLGIPARLTGLRSLRIKETDRIAALETELAKFGCVVRVEGDEAMVLPGTRIHVKGQTVETYDDHRMAMAFAPLSVLGPLRIAEPEVVQKSYPGFWRDWESLVGEPK